MCDGEQFRGEPRASICLQSPAVFVVRGRSTSCRGVVQRVGGCASAFKVQSWRPDPKGSSISVVVHLGDWADNVGFGGNLLNPTAFHGKNKKVRDISVVCLVHKGSKVLIPEIKILMPCLHVAQRML